MSICFLETLERSSSLDGLFDERPEPKSNQPLRQYLLGCHAVMIVFCFAETYTRSPRVARKSRNDAAPSRFPDYTRPNRKLWLFDLVAVRSVKGRCYPPVGLGKVKNNRKSGTI